jgi:methylmalonyl-CoA/ethylmalonyl-CoA epimerase
MLGRLNHVAIAVRDLRAAAALYRDAFGAGVGEPISLPEHGVNVVFVDLGASEIELLEPLGESSPLLKFLEKHPDGGLHHVCYETSDIVAARDAFTAQGGRVLGDGAPKLGARGKPVLFLHPKDCAGALIELVQV